MFPLRGTYDGLETRGGARIGSLTRAGAILDAGERPIGRIDDPTSRARRAAEGAVGALLDAVVAGTDGAGAGHRATVLHLTAGDRVAGVCRAVTLPFEPLAEADAPGTFSPRRVLERYLPVTAEAAALLPGGLGRAAVLLQVEIERRYRS